MEISFVSLVAYGPKVSHSALATELQLLKPGRVVPNALETLEHMQTVGSTAPKPRKALAC